MGSRLTGTRVHAKATANDWNEACGVCFRRGRGEGIALPRRAGAPGPQDNEGVLARSFYPDTGPEHRAIVIFPRFFWRSVSASPTRLTPTDFPHAGAAPRARPPRAGVHARGASLPFGSTRHSRTRRREGRKGSSPIRQTSPPLTHSLSRGEIPRAPRSANPNATFELSWRDKMFARCIYGLPDPQEGSRGP